MILRWLWNGEAGGNFGVALSDNQVTVIAGEGGVAAVHVVSGWSSCSAILGVFGPNLNDLWIHQGTGQGG